MFLEVKAEKEGTLSEIQKYRLNELKDLGFTAFATSSIDYKRTSCKKEIVCHKECDICKKEIDYIYGF